MRKSVQSMSSPRLARGTSVALAFVALAFACCFSSSPASACDFFAAIFGGCNPNVRASGYAAEPGEGERRRVPVYGGRYSSGGSAYCVRTCDGRYFPIAATNGQTRAEACKSFCPASDTKVVLGSHIDSATTEDGEAYSDLPNAFKYRTELIAGCTCNGKDPAGLAAVRIEDDPTLRKGDIVASENGLLVAGRSYSSRSAALNFSPAPKSLRAKFERMPVVAAQ